MLAEFDQAHQMRRITFESTEELDACARAAEIVEKLPAAPSSAYGAANYVIALANDAHLTPEAGNMPAMCGSDADGLIITLDLEAKTSPVEAERVMARSLLHEVEAQGIDVAQVLAA